MEADEMLSMGRLIDVEKILQSAFSRASDSFVFRNNAAIDLAVSEKVL